VQLRIFSFGPNEGITLVPILVAWRIKSMYQTVTSPVCNQLTGLTGGGKLTIHNAPNTAPLEILKTSDDGKVSGISFLVEQFISGSGRILIPNLSVGVSFRVTETVPQNYTAEKQTQVITIQEGTNTLTFVNHYMLADMEILKTSPDGKVDGIAFTVTDSRGNVVGSGVTDQNGRLVVPGLTKGVAYTVEETVPEGYVCDNPGQTVIIRAGTNTVTFENRPVYGSIEISKVDPEGNPLAGVSFLLEYSRDGKNWKSVTFREEGSLPEVGSCTSSGLKDGILTTAEDGIAMFSGLSISIGDNHIYYRLTETAVPEGYTLLPEPAFEGELPQDGSRDITVTAVNSSQYMLPFTGNIGFTTVTFGLLLTELALCAAVFLFRKKKQEG
jgi:hypothetical protein